MKGGRGGVLAAAGSLLLGTGEQRELHGGWKYLTLAWGAAVSLYVLYAALFSMADPWSLAAAFMTAMFVLIFLTVGAFPSSKPDRPHPMDLVLAALSLAALVYYVSQTSRLTNRLALFDPLPPWDVAFGSVTLILALEATRRATGLALTLLAALLIVYNLFGHLLTGPLQHGFIGYQHFLELQIFSNEGLFGAAAQVAATYAYLFVLFGAILHHTGGGESFFNVAAAIAGRRVGGPAKVAVVSSGLFGTISGSPSADVVATGSITIPMMKKLGYSALTAGAIEVAAASGGSLLPPVMGAAAFLMAQYTGISYQSIAIAAVIPALLYYLNVYLQTHFRAVALNLRGMDEVPSMLDVLRTGWYHLVPLVVLVWGLMAGFSPTRVALFGIGCLFVIVLWRCRSLRDLVAVGMVFAESGRRIGPLVGAVAAAGLVLAGVNMTGLAGKVALVFDMLVGGSLFLTLLLAAALAILLGMGMPTPSAYLLAAAFVAPYLVETVGIPMLSAHLFLLYFAALSAVTPPIAVAAFAAAPIAQVNPLALAVHSLRFTMGAFIVPFVFVYRPSLLMQGGIVEIVLNVAVVSAGFYALAIAFEGYYRSRWGIASRLLVGAAGIALLIPDWRADVIGAVLVVLVVLSRRAMPHAEGELRVVGQAPLQADRGNGSKPGK